MSIYKSRKATLTFIAACVGMPIIALITLVSMVSNTSTGGTKPNSVAPPAETSAPAIDKKFITYQGQIISDYKVGEILGEVKCAKRPVQEALDYLNTMNVPKALMENLSDNPNGMAGYQDATRWC